MFKKAETVSILKKVNIACKFKIHEMIKSQST